MKKFFIIMLALTASVFGMAQNETPIKIIGFGNATSEPVSGTPYIIECNSQQGFCTWMYDNGDSPKGNQLTDEGDPTGLADAGLYIWYFEPVEGMEKTYTVKNYRTGQFLYISGTSSGGAVTMSNDEQMVVITVGEGDYADYVALKNPDADQWIDMSWAGTSPTTWGGGVSSSRRMRILEVYIEETDSIEFAIQTLATTYTNYSANIDTYYENVGKSYGQYHQADVDALAAALTAAEEILDAYDAGEYEGTKEEITAANAAIIATGKAVTANAVPYNYTKLANGYYVIKNCMDFTMSNDTVTTHVPKAMYDNNGSAAWKTYGAGDKSFLWKLEKADDGMNYRLTNMLAGRTFKAISIGSTASLEKSDTLIALDWGGDSVQVYGYGTEEEAEVMKVQPLNIRLSGAAARTYSYAHAGGHGGGAGVSGNIVGWSTSADGEANASMWYVEYVDDATAAKWMSSPETKDYYVNDTQSITDDTNLAEKANVHFHSVIDGNYLGHLTVDRSDTLKLGTVTFTFDPYNDDLNNQWQLSDEGYSATLITNSPVVADSVCTRANICGGEWFFMSLPYSLNVGSINSDRGYDWVIYTYSGENRANGSGSTWQKRNNYETIPAGEGFIIQRSECDSLGNGDSNTNSIFTFPSAGDETRNNIFANEDRVIELGQYPSEFAHNRGWNLIGNPYPAYYDTRVMSYRAPFTVWSPCNGQYYAWSPVDDEYLLAPGEAFFVQSSAEVPSITFPEYGRQHDLTIVDREDLVSNARLTSDIPAREVFNVYLTEKNPTDEYPMIGRARFVMNNAASDEYDASVDAAKFDAMNAESVMLYVLNGSTRYAIDERPMGNGIVALGAKITKSGEYTISLNTKSDREVVLYDAETKTSTILNDQSYTFTAQKGTMNSRFTISVNSNGSTAINSVSEIENAKETYNVSGQRVSDSSVRGVLIQNGNKIIK